MFACDKLLQKTEQVLPLLPELDCGYGQKEFEDRFINLCHHVIATRIPEVCL